MNPEYKCIAVDMGAATIRILLGTISNNLITYREVYRLKNEIQEIEFHERWNIEEILDGIIFGINKVLAEEGDTVSSIGIDSWGVDFALLDVEGKLLEFPVAYRDSRTQGVEAKWMEIMSREETFRRTGINFYIFNTLFQLFSIKDNPVLKRTGKILFMPNYIYYYLTGIAFNEVSIASTSQLMEVTSTRWDTEILKHCNISPEKMEPVKEAEKIIGKVTQSGVRSDKLQAISVCSHDTASAVAAIPAQKSGFAFIATGTWCIVGVESELPIVSSNALEKGFTNERGINNTYRILKNILGLWLVQGIQKSLECKVSYDEMEEWAHNSEYSGWLINPENEMFFNPADMMEAFNQYFTKTGQSIPSHPGYYVKCAYDSLCLSFKYCISDIEMLTGRKIDVIHIIGGGCRSKYLCQTTADLCQMPVIAGPVEGSGIGNIMVQGIGAGVIKDLTEGRQMVKNSFDVKAYLPGNTDNEDLYKKYLKLKME